MSDLAAFPSIPKVVAADVTAADDLTSAPAGVELIATAGTKGATMVGLSAVPRATLAADNRLDLFIQLGGAGDYFFVKSVLMAAVTVAATGVIEPTDFGYTEAAPLHLQAGDKLYVGAATAFASGIAFTGRALDL